MFPRNKKLTQRAKDFRKNMTQQERHLWFVFLKKYPVKIYKQKIIGNYIADFYCHSAKLIIEIDGEQHFQADTIEYDNIRTKYFDSLGIKVIRFTNSDCDNGFNNVCLAIDNEIIERREIM